MKIRIQIIKIIIFSFVALLVPNMLHARNDRDTIGTGARILFSENLGQWNERVLFRSQMHSSTLFVERDCFTFVVQHPDNENLHHPVAKSNATGRYRQHSYRLTFEGCSTRSVTGDDKEQCLENYFLGRNRSRWVSGVGVYQSVTYHDLYNSIDMKVYTASNAMKYDFVLHPGAKASDIVMRYDGTDGIKLQNGNIVVRTSVVDIVELRPYAYQIVDGKQVEIEARYIQKGNRITFEVGNYDTTQILIIDPYLHFSTYTGSTADNWGTTGCYDSNKNTYTSGVVFDTGYPVSLGAYDGTYNGNCDIGIFKFNETGTTRLYATYLGGSMADMPHSMYVNSFDELVIFGTTGSSDFPITPNAYDTTFNGGTSLQYEGSSTINFPNGSDIFICRFNQQGTQLQASTYVGGNGNDGLNYRNSFDYVTIMLGNDSLYYNYGDGARGELMTDDMNNIYIGSTTTSTNFPVTQNCIQYSNHGGQDGVVFKIDYNLSNMMWSSYLGGTSDDAIYSIDCDKEYNVVVCGGTNSIDFPTTTNAYQHFNQGGSADGFVSKISYHGNMLMGSTYFGSATYDQSYFVRCSKSDDIFIFGQTKASGSTLIHNANYNTPNSGQFLARFKPGLDTLVWSTVFGDGSGEPNISPTAFAVDVCNRLYLSGWGRIFLGRSLGGTIYAWNTHGTSNLSVTSDAYQSVTDGQDFYIMSLDMDANQLVYATYFGELHNSSEYYSGGDHVDGGTSRFDRHGTLYQSVCASCSGGDNFPVTTGAYGQHNNSNNCNNAIFRLNLTNDFPVAEFSVPTTVCVNGSASFVNTGRGDSFTWDFGDGTTQTTTTTQNVSHNYTTPGLYTVTQIAHMTGGCRETDTTTRQMMVIGNIHYNLDTLATCPGIPLQIGLQPSLGCTYQWISGSVSDSTIANPYVTLSGTYILVISNGTCSDTAFQIVNVGEANADIVGDTVSCSVPTILNVIPSSSNNIYHWSSNSNFSDTLNSNMHESSYSFTPVDQQWIYLHVEDNLGCVKDDSIHVRFYKVLDSLIITEPTCPNSCNGSATLTLTSEATPPFQYNWITGWTNANSYNGYCQGNYTVLFRDGNGCAVSEDFTINDPLPPTIIATVEHVRCHETCTGSVDITVNGNSTYSLLWLDDNSTSSTRNDLCPGTYILQVTDSNGCQFYDTIVILDNVDMNVDITFSQNSCSDECSGKAIAAASGGDAPYSYVWNSGEQDSTAEHLCEGMAVVVVTDIYGCEVRDSVMIGRQHTFDSLQVWADSYTIFSGNSTTLHATHIPNVSYYWMPSDKLDNASSPDPEATLQDTTTFVLTVVDSIGCTFVDSLTIKCISVNCGKPNIFIPNAFTPDNDGRNDRLCFSGDWVREFHITIFTRWGEKVYESDDMNECWDGRFRDNWCMPGVYVYHCRIICQDGQESEFKGDITLIR